jgi:hypothetical protein
VAAERSHVGSDANIALEKEKDPQRRLVAAGRAPFTAGSDPPHGEYLVNDAIVHVAEPSDRTHAPSIATRAHPAAAPDVMLAMTPGGRTSSVRSKGRSPGAFADLVGCSLCQ